MFDDEVAELRRANAELRRRLHEALAREVATAEVLQVINSSPVDLQPVFDAMVEKATRLCGAAQGALRLYDGEGFPMVACADPRFLELAKQAGPLMPGPDNAFGAFVAGERVVHRADVREQDWYRSYAVARAAVEMAGMRSWLGVALHKESTLLGVIAVFRKEVRPFSKTEIALLENFAAQAVIAMENARLITETREALEQQTATAEVLQVINSSPGDLVPVFDAILEEAHTLCGAAHGLLLVRDGEKFRLVAVHGESRFAEGWWQLGAVSAVRPVEGGVVARLTRGEGFVHIADCMADDSYRQAPAIRSLIETRRVRTALTVPLRKDGDLLGVIIAFRLEILPFTDKQIALLQNFAARAVIAMENARLLTETREALEQQTATAEVLQVINASPGDLGPVFDAILGRAMRLCQAACGGPSTYDGLTMKMRAGRGYPGEALEAFREFVPPVGAMSYEIVQGASIVHVADVSDSEAYRSGVSSVVTMVDTTGIKTGLWIALRKDNDLLGMINLYRAEIRPFTEKQISLLQNFAAQAVIAMENAGLLTETREALEQQTATAEVLQVINSSPGELTPVFDAILEKAKHLYETTCESPSTTWSMVSRCLMRCCTSPRGTATSRNFSNYPMSCWPSALTSTPTSAISPNAGSSVRPIPRRRSSGYESGSAIITVLSEPARTAQLSKFGITRCLMVASW